MQKNSNELNFTIVGAERLILIFSAICTVCVVTWVLWFCRYAIDFRDEGFYLIWMKNPFKYNVSVTQFGFIYHPVYEFLRGNIAAIRQFNVLITFCLAWIVSHFLLGETFDQNYLARTPKLIIAAAIATSSLIFLSLWLPTPSYNWLALQALLVAVAGLLLADNQGTAKSIFGWALIGIGGWLAFMAKPTTAAALGLCLGVYLLIAGKLNIRLLALSVITAVGLLLLSALVIDGSVVVFFTQIRESVVLAKSMGAGHNLPNMLRLDAFQLENKSKLILIFCSFIFFVAIYLSQMKTKASTIIGAVLPTIFALLSLTVIFGVIRKPLDSSYFRALLFWSVPFSVVLAGLALYRYNGLRKISRAHWALSVLLLVLPYVYVFGTVNNYWWQSTHASIFWALAALVLLSPIATNPKLTTLLLTLGLTVQLMTVVLVAAGIDAPYGQSQSLRDDDYKIDIGTPGSTLFISKGFGRYFSDATELTNRVHFAKGTPMIDLTGHSPSLLYAIGADSTGSPWLVGDYPGSEKLAAGLLKMVSCKEIAQAWLLIEPDGPVKISPDVLSEAGVNVSSDYETAGTVKAAEGAGYYKDVQFLKPTRPIDTATTACRVKRETNP